MGQAGDANAASLPAPVLVPPVSRACIASMFGPRVIADHPEAEIHDDCVDLAAPPGALIVVMTPGKAIRVQKQGAAGR
jgi:hypothetical protein